MFKFFFFKLLYLNFINYISSFLTNTNCCFYNIFIYKNICIFSFLEVNRWFFSESFLLNLLNVFSMPDKPIKIFRNQRLLINNLDFINFIDSFFFLKNFLHFYTNIFPYKILYFNLTPVPVLYVFGTEEDYRQHLFFPIVINKLCAIKDLYYAGELSSFNSVFLLLKNFFFSLEGTQLILYYFYMMKSTFYLYKVLALPLICFKYKYFFF